MMLDGIRVLDFTQYLAGPSVTRLMAEMGAEVIKLEQAPGGDPGRLLPVIRDGRSGFFVQQNRGKKSLCLDLKTAAAQDLVKKLAAEVDVVVENFGPGVMEKRGLTYAELADAALQHVALLERVGVESGEHVAVWAEPSCSSTHSPVTRSPSSTPLIV